MLEVQNRSALRNRPRVQAILLALLVTLLWSSSWVIIKLLIDEIPPLTFAGLRYLLAFLFLLPSLFHQRHELTSARFGDLKWLLLLGVVYYAITQGGQFLTLKHLDAISYSLMLNFSAPLVAIAGIFLLHERVNLSQWIGLALFIVGVYLYFNQSANFPVNKFGFAIGSVTVVSNAFGSIIGRRVNKAKKFSPLVVTAVSMGVGAVIMMVMALVTEGFPSVTGKAWLAIGWLALVNTAFAYWIWNKSLQVLTALESSVINNTMMIQISLLSWLFLGETITLIEGIGLLIAIIGVFLVNIKLKTPQMEVTYSKSEQ